MVDTRIFPALVVLLSLTACSTTPVLYQHDRLAPPLEVPPDLTAPEGGSEFAIPQIGRLMAQKLSLGEAGAIQMRRDGRLRWLEFRGDARWLWQRVRDFWIDQGVGVRWEDPKLGILETSWITNPNSRYARDRYRVRIEPGDHEGTVWMFVSHRGINEIYLDDEAETALVWGENFTDPELEIQVMGRFLEFLGVAPERVKTLQDQARKPAPEARLEGGALRLPDPPERAWVSLGMALDRLGWMVEGASRDEGRYRVRLPVESGLRGQLSQWMGQGGRRFELHLRAFGGGAQVEIVGAHLSDSARHALLAEILPRLG